MIARGSIRVEKQVGESWEDAFCRALGDLFSSPEVLDKFNAGMAVKVQRGPGEIRWEVVPK